MKKVLFSALVLMMAVLSLHDLVGMAQAVMTPPGKFIPSAQWKKMLEADKPRLGIVAGQAARIVPPFLIRRRVDGPNNASIHTKEGDGEDVTEVYYILEGSGRYTTGGSMADPRNRTAGIKGGETNEIKPGDVIVIPPGTAHWFNKINGQITYIEARFPGNVLAPPAR
jgi:Cupin domain